MNAGAERRERFHPSKEGFKAAEAKTGGEEVKVSIPLRKVSRVSKFAYIIGR